MASLERMSLMQCQLKVLQKKSLELAPANEHQV